MWIEARQFLRARFADVEIPLSPGSPVYLAEDRALRLLAKAGNQVKLIVDTPASDQSIRDLVSGQHVQWHHARGARRGQGTLELVEMNDQTIWVLVQQHGKLLWVNAAALTTIDSVIWLKKSRGAQRGNHKERGGENYAKESVQKKGA